MNDEALESHPFLLTVERILTMHPCMTDEEQQALRAWEQANLPSQTVGSSDWPGWPAVVARLGH
jgi:hypothetical protein